MARLKGNAATLTFNIPEKITDVFDFVTAEDVLPKVLTGYGFLPAAVRTSDHTGAWVKPGSSRIVHLADNTTAYEQITEYARPHYFSYKTDKYTFALRYLADSAIGQWWFETKMGGTYVKWTYTFHSKNWITSIFLKLFIRLQWTGYMRTCAKNIIRHFHVT